MEWLQFRGGGKKLRLNIGGKQNSGIFGPGVSNRLRGH